MAIRHSNIILAVLLGMATTYSSCQQSANCTDRNHIRDSCDQCFRETSEKMSPCSEVHTLELLPYHCFIFYRERGRCVLGIIIGEICRRFDDPARATILQMRMVCLESNGNVGYETDLGAGRERCRKLMPTCFYAESS